MKSIFESLRRRWRSGPSARTEHLIARTEKSSSLEEFESSFDRAFYLEANPDVRASGMDPFKHYTEYGVSENRVFRIIETSTFDRKSSVDVSQDESTWADAKRYEIETVTPFFDVGYYFTQAGLQPHADPVSHYLRIGWKLGLNPADWFDTVGYLDAYSDVADAGVNPFFHYIVAGKKEGRSPDRYHNRRSQIYIDLLNEFDVEFYLVNYPHLDLQYDDALLHYINHGWQLGLDPSGDFSTEGYLVLYDDVRAAGMNPFHHYISTGIHEERIPNFRPPYQANVIDVILPVEERIRNSAKNVFASSSSGLQLLKKAMERLDQKKTLYLSFSHDDYTKNVGGLQLCLQIEAEQLKLGQITHIHLFPAVPMLFVSKDENALLGLMVNDAHIGYFTAAEIAICFRSLSALSVGSTTYSIHSLLGFNARAVNILLRSLKAKTGFFWVHDYSSLCSGYTLLRNDVEYCHVPPPISHACEICVYGQSRLDQVAQFEAVFETMRPTILAPSETAANLWKTSHAQSDVVVWPHIPAFASATNRPASVATNNGVICRIAYLGHNAIHKGWGVFADLHKHFTGNKQIEFFRFGSETGTPSSIEFRQVSVTSREKYRMRDAIWNEGIDFVLVWSIWPETFCITAHEAIAGGADVLTWTGSGHVADLVKRTGKGTVFASIEDLYDYVGKIGDKKRLRKELLEFDYSGMTADFL